MALIRSKGLWLKAVSALILTIGSYFFIHYWFYKVNLEKIFADFDGYSEEFIALKDFFLSSSAEDAERVGYLISSNGTVYDIGIKEYVDIPEDIREKLITISKKGFPDKGAALDSIWIEKNRISFRIESGNYALVWSPDEKPSFLAKKDENVSIYVKSIQDDWYHVIRTD